MQRQRTKLLDMYLDLKDLKSSIRGYRTSRKDGEESETNLTIQNRKSIT